jgi:hypothetical protein
MAQNNRRNVPDHQRLQKQFDAMDARISTYISDNRTKTHYMTLWSKLQELGSYPDRKGYGNLPVAPSPDLVPRQSRHVFTLDVVLNKEKLEILMAMFNGLLFFYANEIKRCVNLHPFLRSIRRLGRNDLYLDLIVRNTIPQFIISIGDSGAEHEWLRHHNLHHCAPIQSVKDASRHNFVFNSNYGSTKCNHTFQQAIQATTAYNDNGCCGMNTAAGQPIDQARGTARTKYVTRNERVAIAVHSIYYIPIDDILESLQHLSSVSVLVHRFDDPVTGKAKGRFLDEAAWIRVDQNGSPDPNGDRIQMSVGGDLSSYTHASCDWLWEGMQNGENKYVANGQAMGWVQLREYRHGDMVYAGAFRIFPINVNQAPDVFRPYVTAAREAAPIAKPAEIRQLVDAVAQEIRTVGYNARTQVKTSARVSKWIEDNAIHAYDLTELTNIERLVGDEVHKYKEVVAEDNLKRLANARRTDAVVRYDAAALESAQAVAPVFNAFKVRRHRFWQRVYHRTEKVLKWCDRHPVIVGMAGGAAAFMLLYKGYSFYTQIRDLVLYVADSVSSAVTRVLGVPAAVKAAVDAKSDAVTAQCVKATNEVRHSLEAARNDAKQLANNVVDVVQEQSEIFVDRRTPFQRLVDFYVRGIRSKRDLIQYRVTEKAKPIIDHHLGHLDERSRFRKTFDRLRGISDRQYYSGKLYEACDFGEYPNTVVGKVQSRLDGRSWSQRKWDWIIGRTYFEHLAKRHEVSSRSSFRRAACSSFGLVEVIGRLLQNVEIPPSLRFLPLAACAAYGLLKYIKSKMKADLYPRYKAGENVILGTCQGVKNYPYIKEEAKYSIGQLDEYYYHHCEDDKPMVWFYGPKVRRSGVVRRKCIHNAVNSFLSRVVMDVNANPKYHGSFDKETFDQFDKFIRSNWNRVWRPIAKEEPIARDPWIAKYSSAKLVETIEAEESLHEDGHLSKRWMRKHGGRDVFLKYEFLPIDPTSDKEARIIMAPKPVMKVVSGPFCYTIGKQLAKKFSCHISEPDNITKGKTVYCSGMDRAKVGSIFGFFVDEVARHDEPVQLTMDHDRFDLHHHSHMFDLQWHLFNEMVEANETVRLWQQDSGDMRGDFVKFMIRFSNLCIRGSGGGETTAGNTVLNVTSATWCWIMTLTISGIIKPGNIDELIKQWDEIPLYALFLGDDNNTVTTQRIADLWPMFMSFMCKLGWSLKIDPGPLYDASFCSSLFVQCELYCDYEWRKQYVLLNSPGRVLFKFAHSRKDRGAHFKQMAYVYGILQGYRELDAIPFMAAWRHRLMELIDCDERVMRNRGCFDSLLKRELNQIRAERRAYYKLRLGGEFKARPCDETINWICNRYDITTTDIDDLTAYMAGIPSVQCYITHPVLERILDVDTYALEQ